MADVIVIFVIAAAVVFALRGSKKGKAGGCCGDCSCCSTGEKDCRKEERKEL